MSRHIHKQTLFSLFEGRATPLQKNLIAEWLADPNHREMYFLWLEEWEIQNPQLIVNVDEAYLRLTHPQETECRLPAPVPSLPRRTHFFWGLAASLLLLMTSTYLMREVIFYQNYKTAFSELRTILLSDGSKVTLNANSTLKVPRFGFGNNSREVFLTGEAEFSVQHLPNHQRFIVRTPDQLEVQVLGTEFTVYSRARGSKVVLNKGKVQLRSLKDQETKPLVITSGDVVTISPRGHLTLRHNQPAAMYAGWKEHRFTFENTSVSEIAYQLTERFGVHIVIADSSLAKRTLGGTFKATTAEDLLQVMADMLEVKIIRSTSSEDNSLTYTLTYSN
ncbi:MAG: FecR domain-containing protein [Spirosomataceae bacterium]